jgi:SRSO17 transposase
LQQLRQALADGVPPAVVLADPAYGTTAVFELGSLNSGALRGRYPAHHDGLAARRGAASAAAPRSGRGRPAKRLRRDEAHRPVSVNTLATELAADAWQQITWRDGSNTPLTSRFARLRVRPAHDDARRNEPADEE